MNVRLGVGSADITPRWPLPLAGFSSRQGAPVSTVAHPIRVRIAVFEDGQRRVAIVSGELLNWSTESDARFRAVVAAATGAGLDDILFAATHTHSAPSVSHRHAVSLGVVDERYLDLLEGQLRQAAVEAVAGLRPVTAARARSRFVLAQQRRGDLDRRKDGSPPPVDEELTLVGFREPGGEPVAAFMHYACHPVVSAENAVSGDYFGVGVARFEEAAGVVCLPLQGCCGDVNPSGVAPLSGLVRAAEIGAELAAAAMTLWDDAQEIGLGPLRTAWADAELPVEGVPSVADLVPLCGRADLDGEWARGLLAYPDLLRDQVTCRVQLTSLGRDLHLLAMAGEVTSPYGLHIKAASRGMALPVAYANGMVGYIPTAAQIAAGGYEVEQSARCYLLPGTLHPDTESRMRVSIDTLLQTVKV